MQWKRYLIPINQFFTFPIVHLVFPQNFAWTLSSISLGTTGNTQEKLYTMVTTCKILGGKRDVFWVMWKWWIIFINKNRLRSETFLRNKVQDLFLARNIFFKPRLSVKCISSSNLQVYLLWIWVDGLLLYLCAWHTLYFFMGWNENWAV